MNTSLHWSLHRPCEFVVIIKIKEGVDPERARRLLASAERCCSALQTLRNRVEVKTVFDLE